MNIFVSIISHGHQKLIADSCLLASLDGLRIIVRENKPTERRSIDNEVQYIQNLRTCGFGENHNKNFEVLMPDDDDWFVICNPDIVANSNIIRDLVFRADSDGYSIAVPYLYNESTKQFDHNVRRWPTVFNLMQSFLKLGGKSRYTASELSVLCYPDWASGAFMAIKAGVYRALSGFDERYFMYMEDVDLCKRATILGVRIRFYCDITIIHNAARASNKFISASFKHHVTSAVRYFLTDVGKQT